MNSADKPLTLAEFQAHLNAAPVDAFKTPESFPAHWRSMQDGRTFKLRKQGDDVYIDPDLTVAEKDAGFFWVVMLHKDKDGYSGKEHYRVTVDARGRLGKHSEKTCEIDFDFEITSLSESRIEGRMLRPPEDVRFDVKECTFHKPWKRADFVWIPE